MRDYIIRSAFHESVLKSAHSCADTFVVDELGLKNGSIRADIAVLNGKLIGYEIKTNRDTLQRLPSQIKAYSEVFDRAYIVTGSKHLQHVIETIPDWWGIYFIKEAKENEYSFVSYRKGKINPRKEKIGLAQLLWKDEVKEILTSSLNCTVRTKETKDELYDKLTAELSAKLLSKFVLHYLKSRVSWRPNLKALS